MPFPNPNEARRCWRLWCWLALGRWPLGLEFWWPLSFLFVETQYEMPFKLSISTRKVRHPSPSNFSVFIAPPTKNLAAVTPKRGWGAWGVFEATEPNQALNAGGRMLFRERTAPRSI